MKEKYLIDNYLIDNYTKIKLYNIDNKKYADIECIDTFGCSIDVCINTFLHGLDILVKLADNIIVFGNIISFECIDKKDKVFDVFKLTIELNVTTHMNKEV